MALSTRLLVAMVVLALFAAACGDDGGSESGAGDDGAAADDGSAGDDGSSAGDDGSADDSAGDDGSADDSAGDDGSSAGDDGSADDSAGDDGPAGDGGTVTPGIFANCEEISDAMSGLDDLADSVDPTGLSDAEQLRQDFAEAQASIAALREVLPADLQDDAQAIADGLAAMEEGFASIGYDASSLTNPDDALAFAGLMGGPEVMAMAAASVNLQQWIVAGCN